MKKNIIIIICLILAFGLGFVVKSIKAPMAVKAEKKIRYWVAPMNPSYRKDKSGKSPMGMDLVPVYATGGQEENDGGDYLQVSSRVVNNLGVVIHRATFKPLAKEIDTVGYVVANENHVESVHSYVDGWIRNARVTFIGEKVKKGQVLFELYSPTLMSAQQELMLALNNDNPLLINASKKKLETLGLNGAQVQEINRTHKIKKQIEIYSKTDGIVSILNIRDGMYIKPGKDLLVVEDLSSVWIRVDVPEKQANWVKENQIAVASFPGLPGKLWQGNVIFIHPRLDKITHTLAVRLRFPNPDLMLKLDMYAAVKIFMPSAKPTLVIPTSAVIYKGDGTHVILSLGKGRFRPQMVTLGTESKGEVSIITGLSKGDEVVVSGQFLIDSESNLSAAFDRLNPHNHPKDKPTHQSMTQAIKENAGKILSINSLKNRMTISHSPINQLGMPEMVMELAVVKRISLTNFKVGQRIKFKLKKESPMHYIIIDITSIK